MTTLPSPAIVDRPFAVWPDTLQVMPEGILDAGFGRFFVGVQIKNTSPSSWPPGEARISQRSRAVLASAGIAVGDGWWDGDASAAGQRPLSEWVPIGTVAASAYVLIFFKMDATNATPGTHLLEVELRNPQAPTVGTTLASAPLLVARTTWHGSGRTFTSACSEGVVTTSVGGLAVDQESFRRAMSKAREIAGLPISGARSIAETTRLRARLRAALCGDDPDVCGTLSDLTGSCAVPALAPSGPPAATGLSAYAVYGDQAVTLLDRARISDGDLGSNHTIDLGIDTILGGGVTAGGDVQLRERSIIVGAARSATLLRRFAGSSVLGGAHEQSSFSSISLPTKTVSAGSTNLSGNQNLSPGNYGTVTIGASQTLTLRAGVYNFAQLTFAAGANLVLDQSGGSVDVRVSTNLQLGDRLAVTYTSTTPQPTALAQFYSSQTSEVLIGVDVPPPAGDRGTRVADPLVGGVATAPAGASLAAPGPGGYGTLGGLVYDATTRAPYLISNAHVWGTATGNEVFSPVMPSTIVGASVAPVFALGTPPTLSLLRVPPALAAPVVFANVFAQTGVVTGGDRDPLPFGQAGTPVPGTTRTTLEEVTITAPAPVVPSAGRPANPVITWAYQRFSYTAVLRASTTTPQMQPRYLTTRRMFTDASTYAGTNVVQLYGEIVPSISGSLPGSSHYALVLMYPLAAGAPATFVPRALQPVARRSVTTVTTSFSGFPPPARLGPAVFPVTLSGFTVDGSQNGDYLTPAAGTVPAGSFVLRPPQSGVRIFVPPCTAVDIDIDLRGTTGTISCFATSSSGFLVATATQSAGTSGRTKLSVAASDIVEVFVGGVTGAQLVGVTARRSSPEAAAPLCYGGTALASDLGAIAKGLWGCSLFVQSLSNGTPVSANVVETAIGSPSLLVDCSFTIS